MSFSEKLFNYFLYLFHIMENIIITSILFYSSYIIINPGCRDRRVVKTLIKGAAAYIIVHVGIFYVYYNYYVS